MDLEIIEQAALRLSLEDRAQLAQRLLLSLDVLSEEERDDVWLTEADRLHETARIVGSTTGDKIQSVPVST